MKLDMIVKLLNLYKPNPSDFGSEWSILKLIIFSDLYILFHLDYHSNLI